MRSKQGMKRLKYASAELVGKAIGEPQTAFRRHSPRRKAPQDSAKVAVRVYPQDVGGETSATVTKIARLIATKTACEFCYS